jgi:hypothetical protein
MRYLTPGEIVVERFAAAGFSARQLAEMVGRDHSRIVRLTKPREDGGTGGTVPSSLQRELLAVARQRGVRLTADELINGGLP